MKFPILLPNIFNHPFTYESDFKLEVGDFVEVPFGKTKIIGVVWDQFEKKNTKIFKIKKIIRKLDIPRIKKKTLNFLNWFSDYNIVPKGMALKLVLLSGKPIQKLNDKFYKDFNDKIIENHIKLSEDQKNNIIDTVPMKRMGSEQDIVDAAIYLSEAEYVTGQILNIDGGRSL